MGVKTYDPKQVVVSIGGIPISGYLDGTFIQVTRDEDAFAKKTGADGETSRAKSNSRGGSVTLSLAQTSLSNDALSALAAVDENTGNGVVPLLVKDVRGTSLIASASAWIKKLPDTIYSKEIEGREWVIDCADLQIFVGGNAT